MSEAELFEVEHGDDVSLVRIHARPKGLSITDAMAIGELWEVLYEVTRRKPKVLLVLGDQDLLSPARFDETWQEIEKSRGSATGTSRQVRSAQENLRKLIQYLRTSKTLCITTVRGVVDLDLLGLVVAGHYRLCSSDTVFENNIMKRNAPPGAAGVWLLTRLFGLAAAWELLLEGRTLSAEEARDRKLVNKILPRETFEADAIAVAHEFAKYPRPALRSLVLAFNHANLSITDYLKEVGPGFEQIYSEK